MNAAAPVPTPRRTRPAGSTAVLVAWVAALAACGGGDGDDAGVESAPTAPSVGTPTTAATCGLPDFTAQVMARVNQWRAAGASCGDQGVFAGTTALEWHNALATSAEAHSRDMQAHNFFSHTGSNGSTVAQRVESAGYRWSAVGENIAAGQTSVQQVVDGWIGSPGHCANLMNPDYRHVAVACVPGGAQNSFRTYWTMNLARPR